MNNEKIRISDKGSSSALGGAYGLAFLGALIYYLQQAENLWMGLLGLLKAIIWPTIVVYKLLEYLQ